MRKPFMSTLTIVLIIATIAALVLSVSADFMPGPGI
jgi:hypothetical protein